MKLEKRTKREYVAACKLARRRLVLGLAGAAFLALWTTSSVAQRVQSLAETERRSAAAAFASVREATLFMLVSECADRRFGRDRSRRHQLTADPIDAMTASSTPPNLQELAELARAQARNALQKIPMLGAVTWLMLQQPATRASLLADMEWHVLPPLLLGQARLFMKGDAPVGYASWAFLSDEAAARWRAPPHRLAMPDWNSGKQAWLVDVLAPFGGAREMLNELRDGELGGRELVQLVPAPGMPPQELRWPAAAQTAR